MVVDHLGRQFKNLRLSLTAACNYACTYCVPDGKRLQPAQSELQADDMVRAVQLLMQAGGIEKLRITGGEPLLTPKFDVLLPKLMQLGLHDVAVTTNGQLLQRKAPLIIDSGLRRINVSLDTLDANRFRAIARSGDLPTVLNGIALMLDAELQVKINMVPMRGKNADQVLPLLDYCLERGIELRFIELMSMGHLQDRAQFAPQFFSMQEILDLIATRYSFERTEAPLDSTAARFSIPNTGTFGIIANESEPFCRACTRLRLSSNGRLYGCLSNAHSQDLVPLLSQPDDIALPELQLLLGRALQHKQLASFSGEVTVMKFIGG